MGGLFYFSSSFVQREKKIELMRLLRHYVPRNDVKIFLLLELYCFSFSPPYLNLLPPGAREKRGEGQDEKPKIRHAMACRYMNRAQKRPRGRVGEWEKGRKTKKEEVRDDVSGVR